MPTATIQIHTLRDKTSRNGRQYKEVGYHKPDGSWWNLSCFDSAVFGKLTKGATVEVEYESTEKNGQTYYNINNVVEAPKVASGGSNEFRTPNQMQRASIFAAICELRAGSNVDISELIDECEIALQWCNTTEVESFRADSPESDGEPASEDNTEDDIPF